MEIVRHKIATLTRSISVAKDELVENKYYLIDDDTGQLLNANTYSSVDEAINELTWVFGGRADFRLNKMRG